MSVIRYKCSELHNIFLVCNRARLAHLICDAHVDVNTDSRFYFWGGSPSDKIWNLMLFPANLY
jgi:hypothetical protein